VKPFSIDLNMWNAAISQSSTELLGALSKDDMAAALKAEVERARELLNRGDAAAVIARLSKLTSGLEGRSEIGALLRAEIYFLLGRALQASGQQHGAEEQLRHAERHFQTLATSEGSARFFLDYGLCLGLLGKLDDAIPWFQRVLDDRELGVEAASNLAFVYETQNRLEEAAGYFERANRLEDALRVYNEALEKGPVSASLYIARARILLLRNQYPESLGDAVRALSLDNSFEMAWRLRAINLFAMGKAKEALDVLDEASPLLPENIELLFIRGNVLFALDRTEEASQAVKRILDAFPQAISVLLLSARIHEKRGELQRALEIAARAVELEPENADAQGILGLLLNQNNDKPAAKIHLAKAIQIDPDSPGLVTYLDLLLEDDECREALPLIEQALQRRGADQGLLARRIFCLGGLGRREEAGEAAHSLLQLNPQEAWILVQAGTALTHSGSAKDAVGTLQRAVQLAPDNSEAHFQLGEALRRTGNFEAAATEVSIALRSMSTDPRVVGTMGQIELALGNPSKAITLLKEALAKNRSLQWAWSDLADALHAAGKLEEALSAIEMALRLDPTSAFYRQKKGWLLLDGGQPDAAAKEFERAIEAQSDFTEAWWSWGEALRRAGHWSKARETFEEAFRRWPQDVNVLARKALLHCDFAEFSQAIDLLQPQFAQGLQYPWGSSVLGWAYENEGAGRGSEALATYEAGLQHMQQHPERFDETDLWNLKGKGNALRLLGRYGEAAAAYNQVLDLAKNHPIRVGAETHALLGWCEYGAGNFEEAVRLLQSALSLDSSLVGAGFDLGLALFGCAQWSLGLERYRQTLKTTEAREVEGRRGVLHVAWFDLQEAISDARFPDVHQNVPEVKQVLQLLRASLDKAFAGTGRSFAFAESA
jgi:tetratricopeptide (TPR) repeat protein